jgi:hypothetical protein
MNLPPLDRSPTIMSKGNATVILVSNAITYWNTKLKSLSAKLLSTYPDVTASVFSTNAVFSEILDHPKAFAQTSTFRDLTTFCAGYAKLVSLSLSIINA